MDRALRSASDRRDARAYAALGRPLVRHRRPRPRHFQPHRRRDAGSISGIAFAAVVLSFAIGAVAGLAAGYFGGWTDRLVGRAADTIMAFPLFVLAMGIVAALGNTVANIVYATAIINMPLYARVARNEASVRREAGFIEAARLGGNGEYRILSTQIMPNALPILAVQMSLTWAMRS